MQVPILEANQAFPPVDQATTDGLLAVGGDLSPERILKAYREGIFPWYGDDFPIMWWSPDPRFVLFPENLIIQKSMRPYLNGRLQVTFDTCFERVIEECARVPRAGQDGTWITPEMKEAYTQLHDMGYAHSVEVWNEDELVGGLYGICLGHVFFGESMFSKENNASKTGFITLVNKMKERGIELIDCQIETEHLSSLGASSVERTLFIETVKYLTKDNPYLGSWKEWI